MPNRFLASGSYGCVYYPGYDCNGKKINNKDYVTKLVENNVVTVTEYTVGGVIKKIPDYSRHFVVVSKHCPISKSNLTLMKKGCKMIDKKEKHKYMLLYSKYIRSIELCDYLVENKNVNKFIRVYFLLMQKLNILTENGIIHNDLHFGNVLFSLDTSNLYIIDFGMAIILEKNFIDGKLNKDYLKKWVFSFNPKWPWLPLDYHFLCYLFHNGSLTKNIIEDTIEIYLSDRVFKLFNKDYMENYKKECKIFFIKLTEMTREEGIIFFLGNCKTWDYYKCCLHFIDYIYSIIDENKEINELNELLFLFIQPNPEKRPSLIQQRIINKKFLNKQNISKTITMGNSYHSKV